MCVPNVTLMLIDNKCRFFGVQLATTQMVIFYIWKREKRKDGTSKKRSEANANETRLLFEQQFNTSIKNQTQFFNYSKRKQRNHTKKLVSFHFTLAAECGHFFSTNSGWLVVMQVETISYLWTTQHHHPRICKELWAALIPVAKPMLSMRAWSLRDSTSAHWIFLSLALSRSSKQTKPLTNVFTHNIFVFMQSTLYGISNIIAMINRMFRIFSFFLSL